jgi:tyrosyl-tRNA synthetase
MAFFRTFKSFEDITTDYESGQLHPKDLKDALSKALNKILQPVRDHFKTNSRAKNLLKQVKGYKVTRVIPTASSTKEEDLSINTSASSSAAGLQMSEEAEMKYKIVRSIGEECIQEDELKNLLAKKPAPICYDGFEPSGRMHIAQGVMKVTNVNKLTSAGCQVKIWIADWFAQLNNKLGGDLERIRVVGEYFKEIWQAGGMNNDKVEFLWASDEINGKGSKYWPLVMDIARRNNLRRILRCGQIMGRSETEVLSAAQILYPCMQCADIFLLEADICQLGMDQRKVNMLAREYCADIKRKNKPIILSHHMLPGLQQGQEKMSKSDPSSAIFMEDEEADVNEKISKAYCPPKTVEGNPCLEYVKYIVLPRFNEFKVESEKNGGNKTFNSFEDIVADYETGELHPEDLKKALMKALNITLQPVRDHFKTNERAKNLLEQVKAFRVTR